MCRVHGLIVGGIQWLYASLFAWYALDLLDGCYHAEFHGKGIDVPAHLDLFEFFFGVILALLMFSGCIGGYGLLRHRRWVRRWEAAYLGVLAVGVTVLAAIMSLDIHCGREEFTYLALFSLAFSLPFAPVFFKSRGCCRLGLDPIPFIES